MCTSVCIQVEQQYVYFSVHTSGATVCVLQCAYKWSNSMCTSVCIQVEQQYVYFSVHTSREFIEYVVQGLSYVPV